MVDVDRLLERFEALTGLDRTTLELLAPVARRRSVRAGDHLFRAGDPRTSFYLILEGHLKIFAEQDGAVSTVIVLGPDEGVGEAALLEDGIHSTSGQAITELDLLELPGAKVRARLERDARAAMQVFARVAQLMSRRLRYSSSQRLPWAQVYGAAGTRPEHDLLGEREIPLDALYGVQTLRGLENFPITGIPISHFPKLITALAMVKQAAARANRRLGLLEDELAGAIDRACQEIIDGHWHGHFVVDVVQGGAGTSTNMNANEVIANRALDLLAKPRGAYEFCHPNNHVNLSQSTNDVYPTAIRVAAVLKLQVLLGELRELETALAEKGAEFRNVLKMGRTQLQDAVPMTLGQEMTAFAVTTREDVARLKEASALLLEVNLGGTAIGTGINADPHYPGLAVAELRRITGLDLVLAENLVEATPDTGAFVTFSGVLKRIAIKLSKLCNDLRLLSSGPRCGLNEIDLPAAQPGSSIMPGKVNPVIPEVVNQVAFQVVGNDLAITMAAEAGQLQLNVMEPVIAFNIFESLDILSAAVRTLTGRCIRGITANAERCRALVEGSIGIVTAVVPLIGYERASEVAKEALASGRPVREIILDRGYVDGAELDRILSPEAMTAPRPMPSVKPRG